MSSSDSSGEEQVVTKKGTTKGQSDKKDFQIKPAKGGEQIDTSKWPLLLKVKPNILFYNLSLEL